MIALNGDQVSFDGLVDRTDTCQETLALGLRRFQGPVGHGQCLRVPGELRLGGLQVVGRDLLGLLDEL